MSIVSRLTRQLVDIQKGSRLLPSGETFARERQTIARERQTIQTYMGWAKDSIQYAKNRNHLTRLTEGVNQLRTQLRTQRRELDALSHAQTLYAKAYGEMRPLTVREQKAIEKAHTKGRVPTLLQQQQRQYPGWFPVAELPKVAGRTQRAAESLDPLVVTNPKSRAMVNTGVVSAREVFNNVDDQGKAKRIISKYGHYVGQVGEARGHDLAHMELFNRYGTTVMPEKAEIQPFFLKSMAGERKAIITNYDGDQKTELIGGRYSRNGRKINGVRVLNGETWASSQQRLLENPIISLGLNQYTKNPSTQYQSPQTMLTNLRALRQELR
ncbi:MAG: hypothetical protein ACKO37_06205, partial [Vampirovibrionales bacterium]